ncbi:hypothetical protein Tco_0258086 [Tanacetum coccineum]
MAYNPNAAKVYVDVLNALNNVPFPLLEQIEACVDQPFSYLEALLVMEFIIAPSVPYARDTSATAQDVTPVDGVVTVESDEVPSGTAPQDNVAATLASTLNVLNSDIDTLIIPTSSIFE